MRLKNAFALAAVSSVAALGVAACGGDDERSVSFVEPMDGSTTGTTVTADVELSEFQIDPENVGKANEEGTGHLHFSMDGGKYDYPKYSGANGELAKQLGVEGQYSPSTEPTITYENLPPGQHTLEVELVNNDHSGTGTSATTTFEATSSKPSDSAAKGDRDY